MPVCKKVYSFSIFLHVYTSRKCDEVFVPVLLLVIVRADFIKEISMHEYTFGILRIEFV